MLPAIVPFKKIFLALGIVIFLALPPRVLAITDEGLIAQQVDPPRFTKQKVQARAITSSSSSSSASSLSSSPSLAPLSPAAIYLTLHFPLADHQNEVAQTLFKEMPWPYFLASAREEKQLQKWQDELFAFYQLKFVLAARLLLLGQMITQQWELIALEQRLAGKEDVDLPPLSAMLGRTGQKMLGMLDDARPFAAWFTSLDQKRQLIQINYQNLALQPWVRAALQQSIALVENDMLTYLQAERLLTAAAPAGTGEGPQKQGGAEVNFSPPGVWPNRDFGGQPPLPLQEDATFAQQRLKAFELRQDAAFKYLLRPSLVKMAWVKPRNFYLMGGEANYAFYQYLFAKVYAPYAKDFLFLAHDSHNFYPVSDEQLALKLNLPAIVRDYKRDEIKTYFVGAARHLAFDIQDDARQTFPKLLDLAAQAQAQQALHELVAADLKAVTQSVRLLLAPELFVWDDAVSLFAHREAVFNHFAFLAYLPALAGLIANCYPQESHLDLLNNQSFLADLQERAFKREEALQHDWWGMGLLGAAVVASFVPFSTWAAPGLWLLAAVVDFGHHAWPSYQQAQRNMDLAQACHQDYLPTSGLAFTESFLTRENFGLSDEEYKSQLQLKAKAQRDLTVATIVDVPLAALGSWRLVKNLSQGLSKTAALAQEQQNWRAWFTAHAYKTMFDKGLKAEDLTKYSRWALLRMMAQEKLDFTMLITFTGFGGAMLAMHLMDKNNPTPKPPHPADLLDIQPITPPHQTAAQTLRQAILYRLKKMEVLQHNFYLRDFYQGFNPAQASATMADGQAETSSLDKIKFYDGEQIVVLLDTIYLPAAVLTEINQLYSFEDLMLAIVERVITERLASAYLMAAVLQHAHQEFWQKVWQGSAGDGARHFFGRQMMMAAQELMALTNPQWEAVVLQQASKLARQYQLLVAQVVTVESP